MADDGVQKTTGASVCDANNDLQLLHKHLSSTRRNPSHGLSLKTDIFPGM